MMNVAPPAPMTSTCVVLTVMTAFWPFGWPAGAMFTPLTINCASGSPIGGAATSWSASWNEEMYASAGKPVIVIRPPHCASDGAAAVPSTGPLITSMLLVQVAQRPPMAVFLRSASGPSGENGLRTGRSPAESEPVALDTWPVKVSVVPKSWTVVTAAPCAKLLKSIVWQASPITSARVTLVGSRTALVDVGSTGESAQADNANAAAIKAAA